MYKKNGYIIIGLFSLSLVFAQQFINPVKDNDKWFTRGTFYELLVRSYKDTDGDKSGDFKGVIEKLDYIKSLGITGIWLLPIHPSSEKAEGYDVTDYKNVNPEYGSMEDFKELIDKAHSKGIKIVIDFVLNHTSSNHPFFQEALNDKKSKYRSWYHFSDKKHEGLMARYSVYYKEKGDTEGYYYARFVKTKPDLNYGNPEVVEYMKSVMKYWIDLGVDGFRYDAISLLCEDKDKIENNPDNFIVMKELKKFIDDNYKDREIFIVAEAASEQKKYIKKDMMDAVFNLKLNNNIIRYVKNQTPVTDNGTNLIADEVRKIFKDIGEDNSATWGTLLSNHDTYVGNRPFQQLGQDTKKTKLAASLYLTLPGIPFVYYGEEIAMDTFVGSKSDKWLRNCMIWDQSKNYGFTNASNGWNMLNADNDDINKSFNVTAQENDPESVLNHYKKLINIRNDNAALSLGDFESIETNKNQVISYMRTYNDNRVIVVHNFSDKPQSISLKVNSSAFDLEKGIIVDLMNSDKKINLSKNIIKLGKIAPFETLILRNEQ